ncbi:hypothetical protein ASPSYDRAFT_93030 [Aspergillus sydowii CBS 593.65]|uniref:Uncharacterized protein n=1 Tax=Aspergillus sydowii CBS 593.65 TaxID=1036612 RepID=A0A1L9T6K2_9EURO|nr:uncharacterized protein ASPSYDRAFT_93030 [Aspergillus sydowii CBS 593.65]OJJ55005.1 hypothetical protein ASPSYDRAFT_93030 [Aspergillus sydowii CBS 593.65]
MPDDVDDDPPLTAIGAIPVPQLHSGGSDSEGEEASEVQGGSNDEEDTEGEQVSDDSAIEKGATEEEDSESSEDEEGSDRSKDEGDLEDEEDSDRSNVSDEQDLEGSEEQYSGDSEEQQVSQVEEGSNDEKNPVDSGNREYPDSSEDSRQLRRFIEKSEMETAGRGDFDRAFAELDAQESRHAWERAQSARQGHLAQRPARSNDLGLVFDKPFKFDALINQAFRGQHDESGQSTSSNIPDVATGIHNPNPPFELGRVPLQWDFNCIHHATVSNSHPSGDTFWPNTGGAFNPRDYPLPAIPCDSQNTLSLVPGVGRSGLTGIPSAGARSTNAGSLPSGLGTRRATMQGGRPCVQGRYNHPSAFPSAPVSQGIPEAIRPFTNNERSNQDDVSSLLRNRSFDSLDRLLLAGSAPLNRGSSSQVPPGGRLMQIDNLHTGPGSNNPNPSYRFPTVAVGGTLRQADNQSTTGGWDNLAPNASSSASPAPVVNPRKRPLDEQEFARRVRRAVE